MSNTRITSDSLTDNSNPTAGSVTIRYFAGARAAAGVESEHLSIAGPTPLDELLLHLADRHGAALARVLEASSFLVDEVTGDRLRVVPVGAVVDVLPPFAGG
ncbi:MoaD/ThiS family protein [Kineosporia sp. NBRC 101731]|uniref:MoaD/ThiS family protein n=1 Tax=Kineosporia sp. NBRC 101731 TaxID=3032199 RepID=UPI0024A2DCE4|nr:MoaD/ThiS family protein [Kineosporia sp. NBRC 101731]GLY31180.1 molybdopterin synthase sulfur carrier subunit [Kineosporia sp. NBRC 101731]